MALMACAIQTVVDRGWSRSSGISIEWTCSSCIATFWLSVETLPKGCPLCLARFQEWKELFLAKGAPVWEIVSLIRCSAQVG